MSLALCLQTHQLRAPGFEAAQARKQGLDQCLPFEVSQGTTAEPTTALPQIHLAQVTQGLSCLAFNMLQVWSQSGQGVLSQANTEARLNYNVKALGAQHLLCLGNRPPPVGWLEGVLVEGLPSLGSSMRTKGSTHVLRRTPSARSGVPQSVFPSSGPQGSPLLILEAFSCLKVEMLFSRWSGVLLLSLARCGCSKAEGAKS